MADPESIPRWFVKYRLVPSAMSVVVKPSAYDTAAAEAVTIASATSVSVYEFAEVIEFAEADETTFIIDVAKFSSSPSAAASSFKVFNAPGAESTKFVIA